MERVIFLDVDGVLNRSSTTVLSPKGFTGVDDELVTRLESIVSATKADIVLTSTWKDEWEKDENLRDIDGQYLHQCLANHGLQIIDKVDDSTTGSFHRAASINLYLNMHPEIQYILILDDFEFDYMSYPFLMEHMIQTDESVGLREDDINLGIKILTQSLAI